MLNPGQTATEAELKKFCEDKLIAYKRPKYIEFRDDLPETMVGKVLRRELVAAGEGPLGEEEEVRRKVKA